MFLKKDILLEDMKKVAVSIHAMDNFSSEILCGLKDLDYIHLDFMDGIFVDTINLNLEAVKILNKNYNIPIIAHLMTENPLLYLEDIIREIDTFLFHFEIKTDRISIINQVKNHNKRVGIAINPETSIKEILDILPFIDIILVLGVKPGRSGQKFIPNTINKVNELAKYKKLFQFEIDVDGGIDLENVKKLLNADIITSASKILEAKDPNSVIRQFKSLL